MEDLLRFGLLDVAALTTAALYLTAIRLVFGDGPSAITPAGVGVVFILTLVGVLCAPLIYVAESGELGLVLSLASSILLIIGAVALLDTIVPKAFRAMRRAAIVFLFPILAAIGAIPVGLFLRLVL